MTFECQMCGKCCGSMGEIIAVREQLSDTRFRIWFTVTGEERTVILDPDKRDLYTTSPAPSGMACPFLRRAEGGSVICTVHGSRPDLCRQYGCFRILVLDDEGDRIGRVMDGTRFFTATDPDLHAFWHRTCAGLDIPDERLWEETIAGILTRKGYRIVW